MKKLSMIYNIQKKPIAKKKSFSSIGIVRIRRKHRDEVIYKIWRTIGDLDKFEIKTHR